MKFEHPLARSAKVWQSHQHDGTTADVLVVVTTLELNTSHRKFKLDLVDQLRADALDFLNKNPGKAASVVLMNKHKS